MAAQYSETRQVFDQRQGQRFTLLLRAAKLVTGAGEFLCLIRDVSDQGLKTRLFHPLTVENPCEIVLGGGERIALECVWQRGLQAGFRFSQGPIAVEQLIEENGPFPKRHLRLRIDPPLRVLACAETVSGVGQLCDISLHGAAIALDRRLPLGAQVRIDAPQLPPLHARVRWRRAAMHGLVFQQGFRLDDLARLGWQLQLGPSHGPNFAAALTTD